jgi:hypothetical protein
MRKRGEARRRFQGRDRSLPLWLWLWIAGLMLCQAAVASASGDPRATAEPVLASRRVPRVELTAPKFTVRYTPATGFHLYPEGQSEPVVDINSVALRIYDPTSNWLRVEASPGQAGKHTPNDANQVFTSIFDSTANAIHVTCVTGCGAVFGTDIAAIDASHQKVVGFEGIPLAPASPANGQVYAYNAAENQWMPEGVNSALPNGNPNQFLGWTGTTWGAMPINFANLTGIASPAQLPPAGASAPGAIQLSGDLGGQATSPSIVSTHLASPLPIAQGGTGLASGGQSGQCLTSAGSLNAWAYCLANPTNTTIHVDGKAFTSVGQAESVLPPGSAATIFDDICGDTFSSDPFNGSNPVYLRLVLARCSQPYVLNVPLKIGPLQQLIGSGRGFSGTSVAGTLLETGPGFPAAVAAAPVAPQVSATTSGCTAYPPAGTYFVELTYANSAGETPPSAQSSGVTLNGASQCLLVSPPATVSGATQYRVYAASATGAEVYQGTSNLGQSVTLSLISNTGNPPATVNSTGALITLGSAIPGSGSTAFDSRVEDLSIDCNGGAQSVAVFNALAQEGSGAFRVNARNCAGAAAFVAEGYNGEAGASNSSLEDLTVGNASVLTCGSGTAACNPTYCVLVDGVNALRHVQNLSCTPFNGVTVAGVEVRGATAASGPGSQGTAVRDVLCQGQAGTFNYCIEGIGAQLAVEHVTALGGTAYGVHLDAASFDSTAVDILPYSSSQYALLDSINSYTSPGGQRIGFYAVGSAAGQFLSDDAALAPGKIYAAPASGSGPATFRSLAPADLGLSTQGDLLTVGGSGALTRLGLGSNGQCLSASGGSLAWSSSCGSGAGGVNLQLQVNNSGTLGGVPGTTVNLATGALSLQPASGQDAVPLTLAPSITGPTSDLFDVFKDSGKTTKVVWVDSSGNLNFSGNSATYGQGPTGANLALLAGTSANTPSYLTFAQGANDGIMTRLFASQSAAGTLCVQGTVPNGDCVPGNSGDVLAFNPMTAPGDIMYGGAANAIGVAIPNRLAAGHNGQQLTTNGSAPAWSSPFLDVSQQSGSSAGTQIDAACSEIGAATGVYLIPPTVGGGQSVAGLTNGCNGLDERGAGSALTAALAPNQYGSENNWSSAFLWRNLVGAAQPPIPVNITLGQFYHEEISGGTNATGTKSPYQGLAVTEVGRTPGQRFAGAFYATNYSNGDTIPLYALCTDYGNTNAGGDEGCEAVHGEADDGSIETLLTIGGIASDTITYNPATATHPELLGGGSSRLVLDMTATPYTTGTISSFSPASGSSGPAANGSSTAWTSAFGGDLKANPGRYCFSLDGGNAASPLYYAFQVQQVNSDTSLQILNVWAGSEVSWAGDAFSGTYHIFPCSTITSLSPPTIAGATSATITVADATNFSTGDSLRAVVSPNRTHEGLRAITNLQMPSPSSNDAMIYGSNSGTHAIRDGLFMACGVGCSRAGAEFQNGSATTPGTGFFLFNSAEPWNNFDLWRIDDSVPTDTIVPVSVQNGAGAYSRLRYLKSATAGNERWKFDTAPVENAAGMTDDTSTAHGVALGEGPNVKIAYTAAGSNGQLLIGSTGADPKFATLTANSPLTTTAGPNSLTIACPTCLVGGSNGSPSTVCRDNTDQANTGSTSEAEVWNCQIPGNTLGASGTIKVDTFETGSATNTGNCRVRIYFSTSTTLDSGVKVSDSSTNGTGSRGYEAHAAISNRSATGSQVSSGTALVTGQNAQLYQDITSSYDTTATTYVVVSLTNSVSSDTCTMNQAQVTLWP